jgi:hypothetical protein
MPLFYVDIDDGERLSTDEIGTEFDDLHAARDAALATLAEVAAHILPSTEQRRISVTVFDDARQQLFQARMVVVEAWTGKTS